MRKKELVLSMRKLLRAIRFESVLLPLRVPVAFRWATMIVCATILFTGFLALVKWLQQVHKFINVRDLLPFPWHPPHAKLRGRGPGTLGFQTVVSCSMGSPYIR